MTKFFVCFTILGVWINIVFVTGVRKDICEQCLRIEECPSFAHLNKHEQQVWLEQVPCKGQPPTGGTTVFGFSPVAKGDYVCCPKSNIWENDDKGQSSVLNNFNKRETQPDIRPNNNGVMDNIPPQQSPQNQNYYPGDEQRPPQYYGQDNNVNPQYGQNNYRPNQNYQNNLQNQPNRPNGPNIYGNGQNGVNNPYPNYGQNPNYVQNPNNGQYPNGGNVWSNPGQPGVMTVNPGRPSVWQNPNGRPQQNPYNNYGNGFGRQPARDQCAAQNSLLPDPQTRCCGRDMSNTKKITDLQNILNIYARPAQNGPWQPRYPNRPLYNRYNDETSDDNSTVVDVDLDDRIAGGKETELDQFPWTAFLKMSFHHEKDDSLSVFNCGGSLISRKYILTAGHCVYEPQASLVGVNVTLAEYDKTTFPRDCKYEMGRKPICIDNVLMFAEDVVLHPQYDDDQLHNDIALVRLQGYAPYTRFIRPICLPPLDIDKEEFTNLPLAVAGWGRNGKYVSNIKQSTVVRLVPHDECQKSYPYLSKSHLCAAGRTGEDTCKGDSGGPLMMMFRGSYYVIGVVSGKRADSPCGTSVPSLYTNVFSYVPWIRDNIRN